MKTLFALTLFCLAILPISTAHAMANMENLKKIKAREGHSEITPDSLSPLQLFASPLQPGGKGLSINLVNTLRLISPKLAKKLTRGKSLIELWVETQVAADEDIAALNNDDRPDKDYHKKLKALKEQKKAYYTQRALEMAAGMGL